MARYWIGVASRDHVRRGVEGGFAQLNHGKRAPLRRFGAGDWILYYSPRDVYPDGEPCQAFTALGRITTGDVYRADMDDGFQPYRIEVEFLPVREAPIRPLLDRLDFIRDKTHWGAAFRFGLLEIPQEDFQVIAEAMEAPEPARRG